MLWFWSDFDVQPKSDLAVEQTGLCGGSKVVEQWTHEPKFEGSNQATEGTGRERKKTVTIVIF